MFALLHKFGATNSLGRDVDPAGASPPLRSGPPNLRTSRPGAQVCALGAGRCDEPSQDLSTSEITPVSTR
jgi:hypothetical protein